MRTPPKELRAAIELLEYPDTERIHPIEKYWKAVARWLLAELRETERRPEREETSLEEAAGLFNRLLVFSSHNSSCCCLKPYEDSCTCGYAKLIRDIDKFTETA